MKQSYSNTRIWLSVMFLALVWGSTWLAIKIGLNDAPPFQCAGLRFTLATLFLLIWLKITKKKLPFNYKFWFRAISLSTIMFTIPYGMVYLGEQYISTGLASVLFSTQSLFVVIFAHFILHDEKAKLYKWLGLIVGISGLIFIFHDDMNLNGRLYYLGMFFVLIAAASGGLSLVYLRNIRDSFDPFIEVTGQLIVTTAVFLIIGYGFEDKTTNYYSASLWISIVYLALIGTSLAFVIYYWLSKHASAITVSFSIFTAPLFAVFFGWFIFGELIGLYGKIGFVLVVVSVIITNVLPEYTISRYKKKLVRENNG